MKDIIMFLIDKENKDVRNTIFHCLFLYMKTLITGNAFYAMKGKCEIEAFLQNYISELKNINKEKENEDFITF